MLSGEVKAKGSGPGRVRVVGPRGTMPTTMASTLGSRARISTTSTCTSSSAPGLKSRGLPTFTSASSRLRRSTAWMASTEAGLSAAICMA